MYFKIIVAVALFVVQQIGESATSSDSSTKTHYLCNFAKVYNLKPGGYLPVRSGPGIRFPIVDKLNAGTVVYICDGRWYWDEIFYAGAGKTCDPKPPNEGLDSREKASCKSGWVKRDWIDVISG